MFERDAALGVILCESTPGGEVELLRFAKLTQIAFQTRSLRKQPEDPVLIEDVDLVFPDHVVDRRQLVAIADQERCQTCYAIFHAAP